MAISSGTPGAAPAAATFAPGASAPAAAPQQQQGTWSFSDPVPGGLINPNSGSADVEALRTKIEEIYKKATAGRHDYEVNVLLVDNSVKRVRYSAIVVTHRAKALAGDTVAYFTYMIESSAGVLKPTTAKYLDDFITTTLVPAMADDDQFKAEVESVVRAAFAQVKQLLPSSLAVLPRDFNVADNDQLIRAIKLSDDANRALLLAHSNVPAMNLAHAANDRSLRMEITLDKKVVVDAIGNVHRSELQFEFGSQPSGADQTRSLNQLDRRNDTFGIAHAWVDVVHAPKQPQAAAGSLWTNPIAQQPVANYVPHIIVPMMENTRASTLEGIVLTAVTTMTAIPGDVWLEPFYQNQTDGKGDSLGRAASTSTDIGVLNMEANVLNEQDPQPVNTRKLGFTPEEFSDYIRRILRPEPFISFDVPLAGASTFALATFADAIRGNPAAVKVFTQAADNLTNGEFSKQWAAETAANNGTPPPMGVPYGGAILIGHYHDAAERKRPIDDVDYLKVVEKFIKVDPKIVRKWSDSWLLAIPEEKRLSDRREIISAIHPSAVYVDRGIRVTPSAYLMRALETSVSRAGLQAQIIRPQNALRLQSDRVSPAAQLAGASLAGLSTPAFVHGFTQNQGVVGGQIPQGYGRFHM